MKYFTYGAIVGTCVWLIFSSFVVMSITSSLYLIASDVRTITSENRDANWIIACDDVSQVKRPEAYKECNQ